MRFGNTLWKKKSRKKKEHECYEKTQSWALTRQRILHLYKHVSCDVLPQPLIPSRVTRSTSNSGTLLFRPRKCKSQTFQRSYFIRVTRVWNTLPEEMRQRHISLSQFKNMLLKYYDSALRNNYCVDDPRTWKSICPKCNIARNLSGSLTCCA